MKAVTALLRDVFWGSAFRVVAIFDRRPMQ